MRSLLTGLQPGQVSRPLISTDGIGLVMVCSSTQKNAAEAGNKQDISNRLLDERVELVRGNWCAIWRRRGEYRHAGVSRPTSSTLRRSERQGEPGLLRDVIARHGLDARRSLGQHFLLDLNLTARIAGLAGDLDGRHVIEVGPGPGGLTRALLDSPLPASPRSRWISGRWGQWRNWPRIMRGCPCCLADALALDLALLVPAPRVIVANLPYNVATPLLVGWGYGRPARGSG